MITCAHLTISLHNTFFNVSKQQWRAYDIEMLVMSLNSDEYIAFFRFLSTMESLEVVLNA